MPNENVFRDLLLEEISNETSKFDTEIFDIIHGAPFITDEFIFIATQKLIFEVYTALVEKYSDWSATLIGLGLAELILQAGAPENYKRLENPNVSLEQREDKAYRLLQHLLNINSQLADDCYENLTLLNFTISRRMGLVYELLLRYTNESRLDKGNAVKAVLDGASPRFVAKLLTESAMQDLEEFNFAAIEGYLHYGIVQRIKEFKTSVEKFKHLTDLSVASVATTTFPLVVRYAKLLQPYYKDLRQYYAWYSPVAKLRHIRTTRDKQNFAAMFTVDSVRHKIFEYCRPAFKQYCIRADSNFAADFSPKPQTLSSAFLLSTFLPLERLATAVELTSLTKEYFETKMLPDRKSQKLKPT